MLRDAYDLAIDIPDLTSSIGARSDDDDIRPDVTSTSVDLDT